MRAAVMYVFVYVRDLARSRRFYEDVLGFPVLESDDVSVKYDAGGVVLALNRAADWGIAIDDQVGSSLLVFHVGNIDRAKAAAQARGAVFDETIRYDIGATTNCYDPDGHCVTIYQPSDEALGWPSGARYKTLAAAYEQAGEESRIGPLVYLFQFVEDLAACRAFYEERLGLTVAEVDEEEGVTKYDGGTLLISLHPLEDLPAALTGFPRTRSIALVFRVADLDAAVRSLAAAGLDLSAAVTHSPIGATARFVDPEGNIFFLYQPSDVALTWPSATKGAELPAG
ncbi:VOC family protein, partial [Micromonospora sp. NPDC051296]|uniref:VOC family protein n=1 Tax=Micromonospora sp. NPDC051296 TaxID=3155046 RepID=UPI00341B6E86